MGFEDEWAANEECLTREAGSLGELLARMKGSLAPLPIDERVWERLVERAGDLPATVAGFPLWLGFPIDSSPPAALLDVSLPGGSRSAAFFETRGRSGDAAASMAGIASLLGKTGTEDSGLRRVAGDRVLLQYHIDPARRAGGEPGFFLYPSRAMLVGGGPLRDFGEALDAVSCAAGWRPDAARRRRAERAYLALKPDTRVGAIGVFPSAGRALRLMMLGFNKACDVTAFLERADWPGRRLAAVGALSRLGERGALAGMQLGVGFDVSAAGLEPTLELQVFSADTIYDRKGWFKDRECWTAFIDGLREERLAVPAKLPGPAPWSFGASMLFGRSGAFLLLQRIHHFSIVLTRNGAEHVRAHVFVLMCRLPPRQKSPGQLPSVGVS